MLYLHKSQNTPLLPALPPPPQRKICIMGFVQVENAPETSCIKGTSVHIDNT